MSSKNLIKKQKFEILCFFFFSRKNSVVKLYYYFISLFVGSFFILKHTLLIWKLKTLFFLFAKKSCAHFLFICNDFLFIKSNSIKSFELSPEILTNRFLGNTLLKNNSNSFAIVLRKNTIILKDLRKAKYVSIVLSDSKISSSLIDYLIPICSYSFFTFYFFNLFFFKILYVS